MMVLKWIAAFALVFLSACANVSTLQTAKTLDKGKYRVIAGAGSYGTKYSDGSGATLPYLEGVIRYGLLNRFEGGVKWTLPYTLGLDFKLKLIDLNVPILSIGAGVNYTSFSSGSFSLSFIDLIVPAYFSLEFTQWLALYVSPKFMQRTITGSVSGSSSSASVNFFDHGYIGGGGGIRLGNTIGVFFEGSYMQGLKQKDTIIQINGALYFGDG